MKFYTYLAAGILLCACSQGASNTPVEMQDAKTANVLMDKTEGCLKPGIEQFGRYIGDWKIDDQQFQQDGSGWVAGSGARWNFRCVGDGIAVQDFWMPNTGGKGTNLRIYDESKGSWDIVWTATGAPGQMRISAEQDESGKIVMDIISPVQNPPRRITFFAPDETGWDWVMEMSFDEGANWTPVYKIRATPWQD